MDEDIIPLPAKTQSNPTMAISPKQNITQTNKQGNNKHAAKQKQLLVDETRAKGEGVDGAVFPSNRRKAGDREAYINGVLQHQPGLSSRFLAAVQTGGWVLVSTGPDR